MNVYGTFPAVRMRRMRRDDFSRRLMQETVLTANDLIYPVFVVEGKNRTQKVDSMPGVERLTVDRLLSVAEQCLKNHVPVMALFPSIEPRLKTPDGREALNPKGLVPRAVAALKKRFPELGLLADVALDPYTSHGQDGVVDRAGYIVNDVTLDVLEKQALVQAEAGVDIVAPSDMMDGRIGSDPRRARKERAHPYADHGVLGEIRFGLLRSVSRCGRLGEEPRRRPTRKPTRWTPRIATKRCGKSGSTSPKAPTW